LNLIFFCSDVSKESNIVVSFYQKRLVNNEECVVLLGTTTVEPIFEDQVTKMFIYYFKC